MKLIMFTKLFMLMLPINIMLTLMMFKTMNEKINLIKKLLYLLMFTMSLMIHIYMNSFMSLMPMMIMITFISGLMIMFIYFTSTLNIPLKKNNLIIFFLSSMFTLTIIYLINFFKINLNNMFMKNNMYIIFYKTKLILMIIIIIMLIMTLYMSFKICYLKKKSMRSKM